MRIDVAVRPPFPLSCMLHNAFLLKKSRLGYKDCGGFTVDIPGFQQPMELIMSKELCVDTVLNGSEQIFP